MIFVPFFYYYCFIRSRIIRGIFRTFSLVNTSICRRSLNYEWSWFPSVYISSQVHRPKPQRIFHFNNPLDSNICCWLRAHSSTSTSNRYTNILRYFFMCTFCLLSFPISSFLLFSSSLYILLLLFLTNPRGN